MKDLIGKRYGRLIVVKKTGKKARDKENVYLCKCDCGNTVEVRSGLLSQGRKKSCGCLYRETRRPASKASRNITADIEQK